MKIERLVSKALSSAIFASAILFGSSVFAQVKIGTNPTTIDPANNLEVEASTAGNKVSVNKTTGKVTIADGTQGPGKVLTSDANGIASWMAGSKVAMVNGTFSGPPNINLWYVMQRAGGSITLPAGKWLVFWRCTYYNNTNNNAQLWWDLTPAASGHTFEGSGSLGRALSSVALVSSYAPTSAIFDVNPTTTTTYYVWVGAGGLPFTAGQLTYSGEGRIFAIPVEN